MRGALHSRDQHRVEPRGLGMEEKPELRTDLRKGIRMETLIWCIGWAIGNWRENRRDVRRCKLRTGNREREGKRKFHVID